MTRRTATLHKHNALDLDLTHVIALTLKRKSTKFIIMIIKSIAIFVFLLILSSLGVALYNLIKNKEQSQEKSAKIVKALTFRISLSIILFIFIFIAMATGLFQPHGIGLNVLSNKSTTTTISSP